MRRKCRRIGEIAVMETAEFGAPARATQTVQKKRRRLNEDDGDDEEAEFKVTSLTTSTTSYIQLRSRRILVDHHRCRGRRRDETRCSSLTASLGHDDEVSCCSSNLRSSDDRIIQLPDLEDESVRAETSKHISSSSSRSKRRETTPTSELRGEPEDLDLTSRPSEANSHCRSTGEKMPTDAELEEFFAYAEGKLQQQFTEKYNYDIVKDEPLEGRYEWIPLKP